MGGGGDFIEAEYCSDGGYLERILGEIVFGFAELVDLDVEAYVSGAVGTVK